VSVIKVLTAPSRSSPKTAGLRRECQTMSLGNRPQWPATAQGRRRGAFCGAATRSSPPSAET